MNEIKGKSQINEIMKKYGLTFRKGYGQNFLYDSTYLDNIVDYADLNEDDTVLEIGPGLGVLTSRMAVKAKKVIAVEIDSDIVPVLSEILSEYQNVTIINEDVLKTDINKLLKDEKSVKVVANLPYYITTPIIMKLLTELKNLERIVIMVQKEVAERLTAHPGNKEYGAITVAVNYYSDSEYLFTVPSGAFVPSPKVDSAVVKLTFPKNIPVVAEDEKMFFEVVKGAFSQRRKTLLNSLSSYFSSLPKEKIRETLISCGIKENARGETLDIDDFIKLSENIK